MGGYFIGASPVHDRRLRGSKREKNRTSAVVAGGPNGFEAGLSGWMRILFVSEMVPYLPSHDGFRLIPANIIRQLAGRHQFHLIAASDGGENAEEINWPRAYCRSYEIFPPPPTGIFAKARALAGGQSPALVQKFHEALVRVNPDAIHLEGGGLASLIRDKPRSVPAILSAHDSKALRYREFMSYAKGARSRVHLSILYFLARRQERRWFRYADRVVVTSAADGEALAATISRARVAVIPNGIDLEYFAYRPAPEAGRIVFTGNMSWLPNEDAVEYFVHEIFPIVRERIPGASFWIVGAQPSARVQVLGNEPGVHVTGTVPDLRPWFWSAAVYVSPLRFGMGVKNKILEAMASGPPIVATQRSLSGTPLIHRRHAMIAHDANQFSEGVIELLNDPAPGRALSLQARKMVESDCAWSSVAARYEDLYAGS
jgi:glycosyltransferase involved in cell wall biosynthesis